MLFRNIFLKTLRDNRGGILVWGIGLGLLVAVGASQYSALLGTGAARTQTVAELTKVLQSFSFLTGEVVPIGTIGGFITVRVLSIVPLLLSFWAAIVGVGLIRGEEHAGPMEVLLSTPQSRTSVLTQKTAALLVAILVCAFFLGLGIWVGVEISGESLPAEGTVLAVLNIATLVFFWGAAGLLVGQLVGQRRKASGITVGLLVATYFINNLLEGVDSLKGLAWLLPFHYYSVNKPLVPERTLEVGPWLALIAFSAVAIALTAFFFARRDIGAAFPIIRSRQRASRGPSPFSMALLGSIFGKNVLDLIGPTLAWGLGIGIYGVIEVATTNELLEPMRQMIRNAPWLGSVLGGVMTGATYLSFSFFAFLPAILAIYAISQIEDWSSEEEEGRMEMLVSMPVPRWQVLLSKYAAVTLSLVVILAIVGVFVLASAPPSGVDLDTGSVATALFMVLPATLIVIAFGLALATWLKRPGAATPITIATVAAMFFLQSLGSVFKWPEAVLNLSVFHLYGQPLVQGIAWGGLTALVLGTLLFAGGSFAGFARRDIAK
jgi:ABC-2 type transport system permease protein